MNFSITGKLTYLTFMYLVLYVTPLMTVKTLYFNPPSSVASSVPVVVAPYPADSTGSPPSTSVDQDAPSPIAHLDNDPFFGVLIPELNSEESSSRDVIPTNIEAMQEELNEFECLEVWELVPYPDRVMIITLKLIFKVKLDELGGVLKNKFSKGTVDPTLFTQKEGKDILLVQIYVDGLQISQSPRGIFLNQSNPVDTPMVEKSKLDEDPQGKVVDPTRYHGMIGSLMYLTSSRPDLVFDVCIFWKLVFWVKLVKLSSVTDFTEFDTQSWKLVFWVKLSSSPDQCDEAKVKDGFDEIETRNIELEYRVVSLIKENEHLKLTYKNLFDSIKKSRVQTKTSNVTQDEAENLKSQLFEFAETKFKNILKKIELFKKKQLDIFELNMESGENVCDNAKCEFQTKFIELENVLIQQTKDFDDVNLELSNRTAKFEAYFEKLVKTKVVLERQLAHKEIRAAEDQTKFDKDSILGKPPADKLLINSQISKSWFTPKVDMQKSLSKPVTAQSLPKNEKDQLLKRIAYLESKLASQDIRSCQKEYHELRTLYNALKVKFDSLNRKRRETNVSKSSKPRESVSAKVHTGESSKPFSRRVSQFTTYSLQKDRKFSKNSQSFETLTPQKGFKKRASNAKHQSFETTYHILVLHR
ncbi:hypothetical protein Tco_0265104 [Tanacetum coccineum]